MANINPDQINQFRALLEQTREILIAIPKNPSIDTIAASLSLFLAITARGKSTTIVCPDPILVEYSHLIGVDKIKNGVNGGNGRNLIVSFPYQEGSIEKVSYNIENNRFNLVIEPREGYPLITSENIQYSYSGGDVDLIITIGATMLSDLNNIYHNNQSIFNSSNLVNIDFHNNNQSFGKLNIIDTSVSSLSELVVSLFSQLGLVIDPDIATNLFAGIAAATQNFTSSQITANTFETAAICLKYGGKKSVINTSIPSSLPQSPLPKSQAIPMQKTTEVSFQTPKNIISPPIVPSGIKSQSVKPRTTSTSVPKQTQSQTPADWLKPKIYRGSTLL
ncbi:hypothetical protein FJY90_06320 [Candidatus Gottesmanbacteria bacterium]|nr:hypothetical protein [Candidatus Gottesmanbacteria bacterium]